MKRVLLSFLCVVMIITAMLTVSATENKVTLQSSHTDVSVGDTVTFTVSVNGADNAKSAAVSVAFPDNFEFVSAEWLKEGLMSHYDTQTHKGIFAYSSAGDMNGDMFRFALKLKTADKNPQNVSINLQYRDADTQILNETVEKSVTAAATENSLNSYFTVRFETNGGSKVKTVTVDKNDVVAEPEAPTKEGYKFDGWYTDSTL
ncbi:MAG: InlB B-repeat-containing protein, partial [Clostridia bacterium]|nr:InlB B-repeat-containing protein [Clostridia bacterium]